MSNPEEQSKKVVGCAVKLLCVADEVYDRINGVLPVIRRKDVDLADTIDEQLISLGMATASFRAEMKGGPVSVDKLFSADIFWKLQGPNTELSWCDLERGTREDMLQLQTKLASDPIKYPWRDYRILRVENKVYIEE